MKNISEIILIAFILIMCTIVAFADDIILNPCADVWVKTFGGGEGCNTFMKFDISPIGPGATITSAELKVYMFGSGVWDGDLLYWNAQNQTWDEGDTAGAIWNCPFTDSTYLLGGFPAMTGWTSAIDVLPLFNRDYDAGHTYCTIVMKDPDDMTSSTWSGAPTFDYDDSLKVGNWLFGEGIMFYPREFADLGPMLIVEYTPPIGIGDNHVTPLYFDIAAYPNPFNSAVSLTISLPDETELSLKVIDIIGREVGTVAEGKYARGNHTFVWNGENNSSGIYFAVLCTGEVRITQKLLLMK